MGEPANQPTDLQTWKAQARAGTAPADAVLRKGFTADQIKAEDGDSRKVSFTISTGAVDRDGDTMKAEGAKLDSWRRNPVVLWAHDYNGLPIAKGESIIAKGGALKAVADFVPAEVYPFAETVLRMLKGGFLRATSIGYRPLPGGYKFNEANGGFDFAEWDLLEFSVVPVPSNPQALMDAKSAGIDMAPLKGWAEAVLDGMEPGLWLPKGQVLDAFKTLSEPRIVVPAFDPEPYLAGTQERLQKRGRVLSQANEQRIRSARDGAEACMAALDEVMSSMPDMPMEEEPKVYTLAPSAPRIPVDPEIVKAAVVAAVNEAVRAQVNAARGRLD